MAGTDGGVTKHVPQNSKALRQIGIWNLKKKAKPKKATIFDDTDNTYQSELRPVPSKFILVLVSYYSSGRVAFHYQISITEM